MRCLTMKLNLLILFFPFVPLLAYAEIDWESLAEEKAEARQEIESLSCDEFKEGLQAASDSVDALRTVKPDTNDYEMAIFGFGLLLKKAESCID